MKSGYKPGIKALFFSGWTILVLWRFFFHFPIAHLVEIALNGLALVILLVFFAALGRRGLSYFHVQFTSFAEKWCFSLGIGSGIVIFLMIGLAALGLLYEVLIVFLILVLGLLVYKDARSFCIEGGEVFSKISLRKKPGADIVWIFFLGITCVTTFLAAATPPFFYDALVYHLAVPHKYLLQHGFHYLPHQHFSNFPMNLGMLFLVGMSFSGGMLAKLISWSFAPMTAVAVYGFTKSRWGSREALSASVITFLVPGVLIVATLTSVDLGVMFYAFLSFAALLSWFESRQKHWFVLSGIFCSLAVGTKYTAIVTMFFPLGITLLIHEWLRNKSSFRAGVQKIILLGLIVLCGTSPWLIKNSAYTGNPLYPFFNAVFNSQGSQMIDYGEYLSRDHSLFPRGQPWFDFIIQALKAPWTVTMTTNGAAGKTGVVFLLCLPGVLFLKKVRGTTKYLLVIAGSSFWCWVFLLPRTLRYVFPMFPPLGVVTADILWHIPVSPRVRKIILSGISVLLIYHLMLFLSEEIWILRPFTYLFGNQSQEEFLLDHGVEYYPVIQYVNREIPENSKILFVGESRGYYCERDYLLYTVIVGIDDNELILRRLIVESQNTKEVIQKLHQMKITHILLNKSEMRRFTRTYLSRDSFFGFQTEKDRNIFRELFSSQHLRLLTSKYNVDIYEIID